MGSSKRWRSFASVVRSRDHSAPERIGETSPAVRTHGKVALAQGQGCVITP